MVGLHTKKIGNGLKFGDLAIAKQTAKFKSGSVIETLAPILCVCMCFNGKFKISPKFNYIVYRKESPKIIPANIFRLYGIGHMTWTYRHYHAGCVVFP